MVLRFTAVIRPQPCDPPRTGTHQVECSNACNRAAFHCLWFDSDHVEHVTECVGGCVNPVAEDQVPRGYQTACDPRLSPAQALECAAVAAAELSK